MPQEPEQQHPVWNPRLRQKLAQVFKEIIDADPAVPSESWFLPTVPILIALALEDAGYWDTRDPGDGAFGLEERAEDYRPRPGEWPKRTQIHTGKRTFIEKHDWEKQEKTALFKNVTQTFVRYVNTDGRFVEREITYDRDRSGIPIEDHYLGPSPDKPDPLVITRRRPDGQIDELWSGHPAPRSPPAAGPEPRQLPPLGL